MAIKVERQLRKRSSWILSLPPRKRSSWILSFSLSLYFSFSSFWVNFSFSFPLHVFNSTCFFRSPSLLINNSIMLLEFSIVLFIASIKVVFLGSPCGKIPKVISYLVNFSSITIMLVVILSTDHYKAYKRSYLLDSKLFMLNIVKQLTKTQIIEICNNWRILMINDSSQYPFKSSTMEQLKAFRILIARIDNTKKFQKMTQNSLFESRSFTIWNYYR